MTSGKNRSGIFWSLLCGVWVVLTLSCQKPEKADLIIYNGTVHKLDSLNLTKEAVAVKDGKIVACGKTEMLYSEYSFQEELNLQGAHLYPGFIDAHAHFFGYARNLNKVDLRGSQSPEEVLQRIRKFNQKFNPQMITGRGWDQNLWQTQKFPDRRMLDSLFSEKPVILKRIDGHAAWVNQAALDYAGIDSSTSVEGGVIRKQNDRLTGILIDKAVGLIQIPKLNDAKMAELILRAQDSVFAHGLTSVVDAGLLKDQVLLLDSLQKTGDLKLRINAMLSDNRENFDYFLKNGKMDTGRLRVCGFKFYLDGALGSRGALLIDEYADDPGNHGLLLDSVAHFEAAAKKLASEGWQMNVHAIGDSANRLVLDIFSRYLKPGNDLRWRVEHAQIVRDEDLPVFRKFNIVPSVQPTHATSDMPWAGDRLGAAERYAYPYKSLLDHAGVLPLGTDFPVEQIDPIRTYRAAVFRKNKEGEPRGGYRSSEALSPLQTLRGMTSDAAYASFAEDELGTVAEGKWADFTVLNKDLESLDFEGLSAVKVLYTYLNGEMVYQGAQ